MAIFESLGKYKNTGLLIVRIGLGIMFMLHGYPKLIGGPDKWEMIGSSMKYLGIDTAPAVWGAIAALAETFGGFLILLGLAFRPICLILTINMFIAANMHLHTSDDYMTASQAIEVGVVFLGLALIGPGRYSVDKR